MAISFSTPRDVVKSGRTDLMTAAREDPARGAYELFSKRHKANLFALFDRFSKALALDPKVNLDAKAILSSSTEDGEIHTDRLSMTLAVIESIENAAKKHCTPDQVRELSDGAHNFAYKEGLIMDHEFD